MSAKAAITAIESHLPERILTNHELATRFPQWPAEKILDKTGIEQRHVAADNECASDLGVAAAEKLFSSEICKREDIDYLLLCTSSPDYALPTTACLVQQRLGLCTGIGAIDINQGCSGFVYGLGLAQGLIETGQAKAVLLITADTYSRYLNENDHSTRTLFGDAAAATLISAIDTEERYIGPFEYGTDGRGAPHLIVRNSASRIEPSLFGMSPPEQLSGLRHFLWMNGPEIFNFTLKVVPVAVEALLRSAQRKVSEVDGFVFHQANNFMLEALRRKMRLPEQKFHVGYRHCGNTVSSSIPIAIQNAYREGKIANDQTLCLVGFGVGYSWATALVRLRFLLRGPSE